MPTTLSQQAYNAATYDLIDAILTANPSGVQRELQNHGFEFQYGQNAQLAEKYLLQLYHNNSELFWNILQNVKVNLSAIPPAQRERLIALTSKGDANGNPNSKTVQDYVQDGIDFLKGTKVEGGAEETTSEIASGAYVAAVIIVIAIIVIAFYLIKAPK